MPKEEDPVSSSKQTAEEDDIPDYAQVDKSRKNFGQRTSIIVGVANSRRFP